MTTLEAGRPAVTVHVFWHPDDIGHDGNVGSLIGDEPALLFRTLMGDPFDPAGEPIGVPVRYHSCAGSDADTVPALPDLDGSERALVVAFVGANILRRAAWREWIVDVRKLVGEDSGRRVLLGVALVPEAVDQSRLWGTTNVHRADADPQLRSGRIVLAVLSALARLLAAQPGRRVRVFFSYARADGAGFVAELRERAQAARLGDFIDSEDIQEGSDFAKVLDRTVSAADTAVLAVITDQYAKRDWCRREVLIAKEQRVPIACLDAVAVGQTRLTPYGGNVPCWRLPNAELGTVERTAGLDATLIALLSEVVRFRLFPLRLDRLAAQSGVTPRWPHLAAPPEPMTLLDRDVHARAGAWVYPDPPLNPEELSRFERPSQPASGEDAGLPPLRFSTVTQAVVEQLTGADVGHPERALVVGISVSDPPEASLLELGLSSAHLDHVFAEICRHVLVAGHRIAYGGDLRLRGFTEQLLGLSRVVQRYRVANDDDRQVIVSYLTKFNLAGPDGERLGSFTNDCEIVELPVPAWVPADAAPPVRAALEFTVMRERMTADIDVRLLVGGRVFGALGRGPGVLEEAALAIEGGVPLLVAGGFGGAGRLIAQTLTGELSPEQREAVCDSYADIDAQLTSTERPRPCRALFDSLLGQADELHNGLEHSENERLLTTTDIDEAVSLILLALTRLSEQRN